VLLALPLNAPGFADCAQCPDVFELGGKIVVIASFSNRSHNVYTHHYQWYRIGEMSSDDLKFVPDEKSGPPDRLDYGAVGVSTIYAGKTGTSALPPFTRRVLIAFTGYGNRFLTNCGSDGEKRCGRCGLLKITRACFESWN
jgi:hypothetical protein